MAQLAFTETALLHIRAAIATSTMISPIVSVGWWKGVVDNARAPDGSVAWTVVNEPRWYALLSDWEEVHPETQIKDHCENMEGLLILRDNRAREAPGTLVISLTEDGLAVEHVEHRAT